MFPTTLHQTIIDDACDYAASLGVELITEWQDERSRFMFAIRRTTGEPGAGAITIARLLELADAADLPVVVDVLDSIPNLMRYYWAFGFRAFDDDPQRERAELDAFDIARRKRITEALGMTPDFGVTFMWRNCYGAPLAML